MGCTERCCRLWPTKYSRIFNFIINASVGLPDCEAMSSFQLFKRQENHKMQYLQQIKPFLPFENVFPYKTSSPARRHQTAVIQWPSVPFRLLPRDNRFFIVQKEPAHCTIIPVCRLVAVVLLGSVGDKKYRNPQKQWKGKIKLGSLS